MDESNRRKLEFKKLLIRLGEKMSAKDEENIRFLYEEDMNQDVSKPTDLFRELLQKDKISHETPGALSAIYRNIGRIDLAIEVEQWSEVMEANRGVVPQNTFVGEALDDRLLNSVAREIGRDWKMLSRHLGLDETSIQSIQQAHFADLHEASYQALLRWKKDYGAKATPRAFKRALTEMKLMGIVHTYFPAS
ncbi:hypothetical protein EMCRGX_G008604 [Ephydatia muelleri]